MRGSVAQADGVAAESQVEQVLVAEGWQILARRCRTPAGELDLITERDGLLVFVEVKRRASLAEAAASLSARQSARLQLAAEIWMGEHAGHGDAGVRFDLFVLDPKGAIRRVADVLRQGVA